jgi:hypothetical protein
MIFYTFNYLPKRNMSKFGIVFSFIAVIQIAVSQPTQQPVIGIYTQDA